MITIAIVGILAAVAVPMFIDAIKKSKNSEATIQLNKIARAAKEQYAVNSRFPSTFVFSPAVSCCTQNFNNKRQCAPNPADWTGGWTLLDFEISEPFYYQYLYIGFSFPGFNIFVAQATGDLDCDGTSVFPYILGVVFPGTSNIVYFTFDPPTNAD